MKSKQPEKKIKREELEERIKFFISKQMPYTNSNFIKKQNNNKNKKFSIKVKSNNTNFVARKKEKSKKREKREKQFSNKNNIKIYDKKNANISSLSTQIQVGNELNIFINNTSNSSKKKESQTTAIPIKKEIGKYVEPRFKLKEFQKLAPKFYKNSDLSGNLSHEITISEIEMLEIEEKLPMKKFDQLETNRIRTLINETFPFHFLIEIEKCYQEISKDLRGNKNKNLDYKIKIAATYLSILMNEENIIYNLFFYKKDINKFLIRELSVFLAILFLNDFSEINENDILDFYCCITYCHLNLIFLIMILINKTNEEIFIKKNKEHTSYNHFQQCKTLIELNSDKIDQFNFEYNFHNNNKIIKSMILNFLINLSFINSKISNNILQIFYLSKNKKSAKFKDVLNNHIRCNELINEKINNYTEFCVTTFKYTIFCTTNRK